MKAIINANIVMKDFIIPSGVILIENGVITKYGKAKNVTVPDGAEIIDAQNNYVGPGLIDIHTHAGGEAVFHEQPKEAADHLMRHGVTGVLPALYFSFDTKGYIDAIDTVVNAYENGDFDNFAGLYMEGPYLNPKYGSNKELCPWKGVYKEEYLPVIEKAKEHAKVWCFAPETEGVEKFVKDASRITPNAVFAVAHSEATPQQVEKYIPYGLKIGTHHTNATGTIINYSECRGVCVDEAVNSNRDIYAELICDRMGLHVDPYMLRLVRKIKGDERIILVSDQYIADGPVPPGFEEATDINFDHQGEISSGITLDVACQNAMVHMGCSVCDAFRFASYNPAMALSLKGVGFIDEGNFANLIIVDPFFNVLKVLFKGEIYE